jgi:type IV secretory pathway protease TraF
MQIIKKLGYHADGTLLKELIAHDGDVVEIKKDGVYINNLLVPNSKSQSYVRNVNLLPVPIGYAHKLQNDEYWFIGQSSNSFDSRYFGVISVNQIKKRAIFLFDGVYF